MHYLWLLLPGILFPVLLQYAEHHQKRPQAILLKALSSSVFVLLDLLSGKHCTLPGFARFILIGQCLGAVGDVVLTARHAVRRSSRLKNALFYAGGILFYLGHLFFLFALIRRSSEADLVKFTVAALLADTALLFAVERQIRRFAHTGYCILAGGYLLTLATAVVFAFGSFFTAGFSTGSLLFLLGAFLFLCSDVILVLEEKRPSRRKLLHDLLIGLYYAGQFLLALSLQKI